ncbi:hypothetical protein SAMN05216576_107269 [Ectopseudomonas chengduensis]|uniref:Uncharacterized protein n=1 Tax=Ectopseudomonas chengduensis TaxID=489632 RepID=A0A1G6Q5I9_9GAMM|nr:MULTISPECIES: hypothetical protein [Pseudomonas]MBP3062091.1 hypothetical protein [Pseudomonas chengduensis]NNB75383.1 hypothetical protein [Pseudomonas chengduensis]OEO24367.1 hypothetical protein AX279_16985 [Pseudomonas sp. J237]SDC87578.1 hypothetical protein SAMN05216576_107269 [Pseudomonas chengduensis]
MSNADSVVVPMHKALEGKQTMAQGLRSQMATTFDSLFRAAQDPHPHSPGGRLPSVGPWQLPIRYAGVSGEVSHVAGALIDAHRAQRPFTSNAIELRCDCLSLCIYVSGVIQLSGRGNTGTRHARVVAYLKDSHKAFDNQALDTPASLIDHLHGLLMSTYNKLAREHNLAGFPGGWLKLRSSHPEVIPDIPIILDVLAR